MQNLNWLYDTNDEFHDSVCEACTAWLGNTSANFADAWLRETHREQCVESDYEDLRGQHADEREIDTDGRQLFVLDEHNMRRLYHIGFMDCKDGHYNTPAHGLNNIEFMALSDYESKASMRTIADMSEKDGDCVQHESGMSEVDTREKLEADVDKSLYGASMADDGYIPFSMVIGWLDRQAAITERELCNGCDWPSIAAQPDSELEERLEIQRQTIEYLQSELDKRDKGIERLKCQRDEAREELKRVKRKYSEKLADVRTLPSVERVRELEDELVRIKAERDELKAEQLSWPTMLQYKDACAERDAYRELCGRFRKMANEMLVMEVD